MNRAKYDFKKVLTLLFFWVEENVGPAAAISEEFAKCKSVKCKFSVACQLYSKHAAGPFSNPR